VIAIALPVPEAFGRWVVKSAWSAPKPVDSNACERSEMKLKSTQLFLSKVSSVCFVRARKVKKQVKNVQRWFPQVQ
jgi:hypothetical protein